jgi:hypothetical protein
LMTLHLLLYARCRAPAISPPCRFPFRPCDQENQAPVSGMRESPSVSPSLQKRSAHRD